MENLNAKSVKKALECWASGKPCEGGVCDLFDASTFTCDRWTGKNALAVITSQEQRIKELIDELDDAKRDTIPKLQWSLERANEMGAEADRKVAELTEENAEVKANWQKLKESHESACEECRAEFNRLTEENERLSQSLADSNAEYERLKLEYAGFEAGAKDVVSFLKADTVKKMQSEIESRCVKGGIYPAFVKSTIDQIAKEMLEGEK